MNKEKIVFYTSALIAAAFISLGILLYKRDMHILGLKYLDFIVTGTSAFLFGPGIYDMLSTRRIKKMEERFPDFLRDVAESSRFGMTLAEAIVVASSGRYGALTDEIKRLAAKINWGVPVRDALLSFNERVKTPLIDRIIAIVIKSNEAGGNVSDVLNMVARSARDSQLSQKERNIEMFTYGFVLLTSFFVFLATIIILNNSFLPEMGKAGMAVEESFKKASLAGALPGGGIAYEYVPIISFLFVIATIIHGIGDGIMIGILSDGRIKSGFIWAFVLLVSGYFILRLLGAA
ncbi:archaeal flagella assembly protein J [Aciduliprofundum sp. MAR08-339]|uniref:type II secretion system F family protein n=1 Tax=Aciduliprofundum sp. (strain MAR08-339) TaxID=673860 RepID=UPI0002A47887|nr:archaeal flagella assembly protein J [Aciduliprofundum sp. MAR08-339]